jgi:hypothetical protein
MLFLKEFLNSFYRGHFVHDKIEIFVLLSPLFFYINKSYFFETPHSGTLSKTITKSYKKDVQK